MQGRTCKMFKQVIGSQSGKRVVFRQSDALGGIEDTLGRWKETTENTRTIELTTVTLGEILETVDPAVGTRTSDDLACNVTTVEHLRAAGAEALQRAC